MSNFDMFDCVMAVAKAQFPLPPLPPPITTTKFNEPIISMATKDNSSSSSSSEISISPKPKQSNQKQTKAKSNTTNTKTQSKTKTKTKTTTKTTSKTKKIKSDTLSNFLSKMTILVVPLLPLRSQQVTIFHKRLQLHGATIRTEWTADITHVILSCDSPALNKCKIKGSRDDLKPNVLYLQPTWISDVLSWLGKKPETNANMPKPQGRHLWKNRSSTKRSSSSTSSSSTSSSTSSSSYYNKRRKRNQQDDMNEQFISQEKQAEIDSIKKSMKSSSSSSSSSSRPTDVSPDTGSSEDIDLNHPSIQEARCVLYAMETAKLSDDKRRLRSLNWLVRNRTKWTCQRPTGAAANAKEEKNIAAATVFDEVADAYNAMGSQDQFRERAFRSFGKILRSYHIELIYDWQVDDMKKTYHYRKGMTEKMCSYTKEIIKKGTFERKETLLQGPQGDRLRELQELQCIHSVGKIKAESLYNVGIRSVQQLRERIAAQKIELDEKERKKIAAGEEYEDNETEEEKERAKPYLTKNGMIGLKHFNDLQERIPRKEVKTIASIVKEAACRIAGHSNLKVLPCGSFRRGKSSSGDVDVLISDPTPGSNFDLIPLLATLHREGFLIDDLALPGPMADALDTSPDVKRQTYMGVCKVPMAIGKQNGIVLSDDGTGNERTLNRRLDIKVFPYHLWSYALLYFTGSDHFNRSMRLYAKKLGWSLSDKGLSPAFRVKVKNDSSTEYKYQDDKVWVGASLVCETEEDIFKALGLIYREPAMRTSDPNALAAKSLLDEEAKSSSSGNKQEIEEEEDDEDGDIKIPDAVPYVELKHGAKHANKQSVRRLSRLAQKH